MKITNPEVIKNGEKDLIASLQEDLDPDTVREILKERLDVAALSSKGGRIVVHDNEIAFKLDFEVNLSGSLLFDRDGNLLEDQPQKEPDSETPDPEMDLESDLNLDDGPDDSLEDLGDIVPGQNLTGDPADGEEESPIDDLSIDLPEYDLDDEPDEDTETPVENDPKTDLDDELESGLDDELDDFIEETQLDEDSDEKEPIAKDLDDDIDDILKESRDFWEKKEES